MALSKFQICIVEFHIFLSTFVQTRGIEDDIDLLNEFTNFYNNVHNGVVWPTDAIKWMIYCQQQNNILTVFVGK